MVYVVEQYPGYGLYPGYSGYINANDILQKSTNHVRGGPFPADTLENPFNSGTFVTYSDWCSAVVAAGIKLVRVRATGCNYPQGEPTYGLEPPPHGTYNVWDTALDDTNLATFRAAQVSGTLGGANFSQDKWDNSNIKQFLDACEASGLKVWWALEGFHSFKANAWRYHAWNYNNYYLITGDRCESQDRGFLAEPYEIYTSSDAIQAMKDRISFIIGVVGSSPAVCMWGLWDEQNWTFNQDYWGETEWNATMVSNIRDYVVPWVSEIGQHIRSEDMYNRPIVASVMRTRPDFTWPDSADHYANVIMEPFLEYPIDAVATNLYHGEFGKFVDHLNACREKIEPKKLIIHQYWPEPWILGTGSPLRVEYAPYTNSKQIEWLGITLKWGIGAGRWPGLVESSHNVWTNGNPGDPDFYSIGGSTSTGTALVNWKDWLGAVDWSDYVSSTGMDKLLCTGDGDHLVMTIRWTSTVQKTVTVSNVTDGAWTVKVIAWDTNSVQATETPTASSNSFSFTVMPGTENISWVYAEKD